MSASEAVTASATIDAPSTLPAAVRNLLASHGLGEAAIRFAVKSASRVDTGGWLHGEPLWAVVAGNRFVLAAAGPRPSLIELPLEMLASAVYNHVTGAVVFPRGPSGQEIPPVRLDPLVARSLVALAAALPTSSPGTLSHA
jgi:hypothetical protein